MINFSVEEKKKNARVNFLLPESEKKDLEIFATRNFSDISKVIRKYVLPIVRKDKKKYPQFYKINRKEKNANVHK